MSMVSSPQGASGRTRILLAEQAGIPCQSCASRPAPRQLLSCGEGLGSPSMHMSTSFATLPVRRVHITVAYVNCINTDTQCRAREELVRAQNCNSSYLVQGHHGKPELVVPPHALAAPGRRCLIPKALKVVCRCLKNRALMSVNVKAPLVFVPVNVKHGKLLTADGGLCASTTSKAKLNLSAFLKRTLLRLPSAFSSAGQ